MRLLMKGKMDHEKKLRAVKNSLIESVLKRYLRFCLDQHLYTILKWREKVLACIMSKKERICFGFKLAFKKELRPVKLKCKDHGTVNYNP